MTPSFDLFCDTIATLGEGPVWDAEHDALLWVDIDECKLHVTNAAGEVTRTYPTGERVGAVALHADGDLLIALGTGFARLRRADGAIERLAGVADADPARVRVNDGEVDPQSRYWAGTIAFDREPICGLYRVELDGTVTRVFDGVTISNGLAWSHDGLTLFYIDTVRQAVARFAFDPVTGALGERAVHVDTDALSGSPDGMTIDADGNLWVAFWGGWCVRCFSGADGTLLDELVLPVSQPTAPVFGGADLRTLYVTSAHDTLDAEARAAQPQAGMVFAATPGVQGVLPRRARVA